MKTKRILLIANLLIVPMLLSCTRIDRDYTDYLDVTKDALHLDTDFFSMNSDKYLLYIYREDCTYCVKIKFDVFDYLDRQKNNAETLPPLYLTRVEKINTINGDIVRGYFKKITSEESNQTYIQEMKDNKASKTSDVYFLGTPSLYVIENNTFDNLFIGDTDIPNYLESL